MFRISAELVAQLSQNISNPAPADTACLRVSRKVDNIGPAQNIGARNKAPVPAVKGFIAIVAQYEKIALGNPKAAVPNELRHLSGPARFEPPYLGQFADRGRKLVPKRNVLWRIELGIGLAPQLAIHVKVLVDDPYRVPTHSHHPFKIHHGWIGRKTESYDVASLRRVPGVGMEINQEVITRY